MFTALFAFSMNNANALTEEECDVTPGMNWDGAKCMDAAGEQNGTEYREGIEYIVYKHGVVQTYNGKEVYTGPNGYSINKVKELVEGDGKNFLELHALCASNSGTKGQPGNPQYSETGDNCWCRIKTVQGTSSWVFSKKSTKNDGGPDCAEYCGYYCATDFHFFEFRKGAISTIK